LAAPEPKPIAAEIGMDSDEALMLRVARGDEPAFHLLVRRHAARAIGLARRVTGNDADAEEIVQEAWLRVWRNAPRWRPTAAFRTWFYRVLVNLCLNRRRRRPWLGLEAAGDPADPAPDASVQLQRHEFERLVAAAVAGLPPQQRAAIALTYGEGFSNAQTAAVLENSVAGVEALLVRARRALRAELADALDRDH
jgi:RNA polymerase sigma-70 factor (ECF subfamily)